MYFYIIFLLFEFVAYLTEFAKIVLYIHKKR